MLLKKTQEKTRESKKHAISEWQKEKDARERASRIGCTFLATAEEVAERIEGLVQKTTEGTRDEETGIVTNRSSR